MAFTDSKKILVLGMGKSGRAAASLLAGRGYDVVVYDENQDVLDEFVRSVEAASFYDRILAANSQDVSRHMEVCDRLVLSPGVPLEHPLVTRAKQLGIPVDGEIEAAFHFAGAKIIGVTATNGKSTTVGVIGRILESAGVLSAVAGNIGKPFSEVAADGREYDVLVLELSSFQLDTITDFRTDVAVLLNVTPDHLDRYHHSFDEYASSKARILNRSDKSTSFVYNYDDPVCRRIADAFGGNKIPFSSTTRLNTGVYFENGLIHRSRNGLAESVLPRDDFGPIGVHNLENALASVAAVIPLDIGLEYIRSALRSYRPLAHRMELVREVGGVKYINDSKATNVDATVKSLISVTGQTILILGGKDKEGDFFALIPYLGHVRRAILIGEASAAVRSALNGHCSLADAVDMADAVNRAHKLAQAGDTVLLAPACASFDMFKNYEERGEVFRSCVKAL